jgi:hypothetical protein
VPDYRLPKRLDRITGFSSFRSYAEDADGWLVAIEHRSKHDQLLITHLHEGKTLAVFASGADAAKAIETLKKRIKGAKK